MKKAFQMLAGCLALSMLCLSGCVTVGNRFSQEIVSRLKLGQTTQVEIEQELGKPFRTGVDSGDPTATYLYYHVGLFSEPITEDLTITYNAEGKVKAFAFNSNQ